MMSLSENLQRFGLIILLLLFVGLSLAYNLNIPLSKAPDEYVHLLYSRFIVENGRLPVTIEERQTAGYKSDQPPLYYGLVALATGWIDTDGPPVLKMTWDSPRRKLADIVLPRGMIVWTEDETPPYRGTVLAWFAGRWLSTLLSAVTIILVYYIALEIFPNKRHLALGAAAALAFAPAYLFISSVLNDDNLIDVILALFFFLLVRIAKGNKSPWLFIGLGVLMGLAVTTKYSSVVLPVEMVIALALIGRRWGWSRKDWVRRVGVSLAAAAVTGGWWFIFVGWHFNEIDELGWSFGLIKPIVAGDASDPTVARLTGLLVDDDPTEGQVAREPLYEWITTFFIRFWEVPVFGKPPLYPPIYTGLLMLLLGGLSFYGVWRIWRRDSDQNRFWLQLLTLHLLTFLVLPLIRYFVSGKIHDTAQARHLLFPAAPAFGILLVWGLSDWFSEKRWFWRSYLLVLVLLGLSLAQLYYFSIAFPARLPVRTVPELAERPTYLLSKIFDDGIKLAGYDQHLIKDLPALEIVLHWQSLAYAREDYLTEISLLDDNGRVVAQTVAHSAHGRYPTRAWDPGDTVRDTIVLPLAGVPRDSYDVRLRLLGWDAPLIADGTDNLMLNRVDLPLPSGNRVSPQGVLQGKSLIGFDLWQGGAVANGMPTYRYLADIPIALYDVPTEVEIRLRLVGPDGQPRMPVAGAGRLQTFIVEYDWPSGVYWLEGELWQGTSLLERLKSDSALVVENRSVSFDIPSIGHRLDANFGDELLLLGYDLPSRRVKASEGVPILLYWQALKRMRESYVIFTRLLDTEQHVFGGYDRLPQETYSTILWVPDEVVIDGFILPIDADAPDGVYYLVLGLYQKQGGEANSLPLMSDGSPTKATSVTIGPVKLGGPSPGVTVVEFKPQVVRNDLFGDEPLISLQGYDLESHMDRLTLTLYWRSEAQTETDYTRFVHLRDLQGHIVAQNDGPPGEGVYLTSLWDAGEVIADETVIQLPEDLAPASYTLVAGLYDPVTGQRLPVPTSTAGDDSLHLTTVELR